MKNSTFLKDEHRETVTISQIVSIIWGKKIFIFNISLIIFIVSSLITLMMPKTYRASTVLLSPNNQPSSSLMGMVSSLPIGGFLSGETDETMKFLAILKSRTIKEDVIKRFNLIKVYESQNIDLALNTLSSNLEYIVEDEGTIRIAAKASTNWFHPDSQEQFAKQLCTNIANYLASKLDSMNNTFQSDQAHNQRVFIEKRYNENKSDLKNAEEQLKKFEEKYNLISLPDQTQAGILAAADIKKEIINAEIRLNLLKQTVSLDNPQIVRANHELTELKKQFEKFQFGSRDIGTAKPNSLFPVFSEVPELATQYFRLKREVEIQNTLFKYLTRQFEEAKIQEAKSTPTVQVLDKAVTPFKRSSPKRSLLVLLAVISGFVIATSYLIYKSE